MFFSMLRRLWFRWHPHESSQFAHIPVILSRPIIAAHRNDKTGAGHPQPLILLRVVRQPFLGEGEGAAKLGGLNRMRGERSAGLGFRLTLGSVSRFENGLVILEADPVTIDTLVEKIAAVAEVDSISLHGFS
jgi:hypothetical protein